MFLVTFCELFWKTLKVDLKMDSDEEVYQTYAFDEDLTKFHNSLCETAAERKLLDIF